MLPVLLLLLLPALSAASAWIVSTLQFFFCFVFCALLPLIVNGIQTFLFFFSLMRTGDPAMWLHQWVSRVSVFVMCICQTPPSLPTASRPCNKPPRTCSWKWKSKWIRCFYQKRHIILLLGEAFEIIQYPLLLSWWALTAGWKSPWGNWTTWLWGLEHSRAVLTITSSWTLSCSGSSSESSRLWCRSLETLSTLLHLCLRACTPR